MKKNSIKERFWGSEDLTLMTFKRKSSAWNSPSVTSFLEQGHACLEEWNLGSKENEWAQQVGKVGSCSVEHLVCQPLLVCLPGTTWQCLESLLVTGTGAAVASRSQGCCWAGQPLFPTEFSCSDSCWGILVHIFPTSRSSDLYYQRIHTNFHSHFLCSSFLFTSNIPFVLCLH